MATSEIKMDCRGRTILRRIASGVTMAVLMSLTLQATITSRVRAQEYDNPSSGLGSVDDYAREKNAGNLGLTYEVPELGIEVSDGMGRLGTGALLRGAKVIRVNPKGPAARAGLENQQNIGKLVLAGAFMAGGLFFPPAFLGAIVVAQSDIGESHDTIVAVDAERTRDVQEFEDAVGKGREGPILYLSVIRGGHRYQIQVSLSNGND